VTGSAAGRAGGPVAAVRGRVRAVVFGLLRWAPPALLRVVPWPRPRRLLLRWLNGALAEYPRRFTTRTRHGFVVRGDTRDLVQRFIRVFGVWEPSVSAVALDVLQPGDVAVDVGANIGYYSLLFAGQVGPHGRVVAVEPVPSIVARLRENLRLNRVTTVDVAEAAAAEAPGSVEVFRAPGDNLGRSATVAGQGFVSEGTVRKVPAAELVPVELWPRVRLVKVDTEGDELGVLRGLEPLLEAMPAGAVVLAELSPDGMQERGGDAHPLLELMAGLGFRAEVLPNSYEVDDYIAPRPQALRPLTGAPEHLVDVLFRKDRAPDDARPAASAPRPATAAG
jgi:FkbM family methyltransferase